MVSKTLETIQDIMDYVRIEENGKLLGVEEHFVVRNIERGDDEDGEHWVENWDKGNPEKIKISYELYIKCLDHEFFGPSEIMANEEKEFYLGYYPSVEEYN